MVEMIERAKEIMQFEEMIKSWTRKELRTRYKGSFLGFLWTFVNPLLQLVVYSIIFPFIMKFNQENYAMFMFVALIPWNFFTASLQGASGIIVWNSSMVTKVYFPREILPISYTLSGLCNMIFSYMIVFPMLFVFRVAFTWNLLWLPVLFLVQTILCLGLTFIVCSINVYFRDLENLISVGVLALYFLSPVMYDITAIPSKLQKIMFLNPMTGLLVMYRDVTFKGEALDLKLLGFSIVYACIFCLAGWKIFIKLQKKFTEIL